MPADNVVQTYLALRLAMVLLALLLFAAVAVQLGATGFACLQPSISAYYYTPARPVLVGALCGIGAGLIVYRGSTDVENVLLDFAGFMAFVVAFVPTRFAGRACGVSNVPSAVELSTAVRQNVGALLMVAVLAVGLAALLPSRRYAEAGRRLSASATASLAVSLGALVAGGTFFVLLPATFERIGHELAATVLFLFVLAVVVVNARESRRTARRYHRWYVAVAVVTVLVAGTLLVAGRLLTGFDTYLFFVEATLILGFAVFWIVQTAELRGATARRTDPDRAEAAP